MQIGRIVRLFIDQFCIVSLEIVKTIQFLVGCYIISEVVTKPTIEYIKWYHYR